MKRNLIMIVLFLFLTNCVETKFVNGEKKIDVSETIKSNTSLVIDGVVIGGMIAK